MWPTDNDDKLDVYDMMELPGQQLNASNATTPLDHLLQLELQAPASCLRKTAIAATMGKSTFDVAVLKKMMESGMNIAVLNMNFGDRADHVAMIKLLRKAAKEYSIQSQILFPLAIAVRLAGRKIKTGRLSEGYSDSIEIKVGDIVRLTTDETYKNRCSVYTIYIDYIKFPYKVKKNNTVFIDNELIMLHVDIVSKTTLTCKVLRGGMLGSFKDVLVPNVNFDMPVFSDRDKDDISMCVHYQVDIVMPSFVNSSSSIEELRSLLGDKGKKISVVANIQSFKGYDNFDLILSKTDGILITRQELGSDINPKKLVIAQKNMIARANSANVPVFVNAHILQSMRKNEIPTRAELLDVANCILDGADGLMLSAETAIGNYPVETVVHLSNACKEAEACIWTKQNFHDLVDKTSLPCNPVTGLAMAAVLASQRALAAAIVVITVTGRDAQILSKYKPRCPILAVTRYPLIARKLHLWSGILPLQYESAVDPDWQVDIENRIDFAIRWGIVRGFIREGDPIVVLSGFKHGSSTTNTMKIIYATSGTVEP